MEPTRAIQQRRNYYINVTNTRIAAVVASLDVAVPHFLDVTAATNMRTLIKSNCAIIPLPLELPLCWKAPSAVVIHTNTVSDIVMR